MTFCPVRFVVGPGLSAHHALATLTEVIAENPGADPTSSLSLKLSALQPLSLERVDSFRNTNRQLIETVGLRYFVFARRVGRFLAGGNFAARSRYAPSISHA